MRLITRSDFDGLICAVFLKELGVIDSWEFVHPKDLQDGLFKATENDCLANVPYVPGCGLWFDHHSSELERSAFTDTFKGSSKLAPSAARVIFDYYNDDRLSRFSKMLEAVDKVDSANLAVSEIMDPEGWILLGYIMDPRTGLGRFRDFSIPNYKLMEELIPMCQTQPIKSILSHPHIKERVDLYKEQDKKFKKMLTTHTKIIDQVIITDLRGVDPIYAGNRFIIYSLFVDQNISVWIVDGKDKKGCSAAVGHSVLNHTSKVDVGSLMLKYGGGGHKQVGTCQFSNDNMETGLKSLLDEIVESNK